MTNEEAIKGLTSLVEVRRKYFNMQTMKDEIECLDMAIKALKQEPILEKIRAEIEELNPVDYGSIYSYESHNGARNMKNNVLAIIDKCKAESVE